MNRPYKTTLAARESQKKYYQKNKTKQDEAKQKWIKEHPDYHKNYKKQWLEDNSDYAKNYNKTLIKYKGKMTPTGKVTRTGVCSRCGSKDQRTNLHHTQYDDNDVLKHTIELCVSCHAKEHKLGVDKKE